MNNNTLIVYHADCIDGLAAAWSTARALPQDKCTFIPFDHADGKKAEAAIRAGLTGMDQVYFVDVAPRAEFLRDVCAAMPKTAVTVIDHHVASAFELADLGPMPGVNIVIDTHHPSAANMVWEHFFPAEQKPFFLSMIGKMDLGLDLKTDDDFAAAAAIDTYDISSPARAFASFAALQALPAADLIKAGKAGAERQIAYGQDVKKTIESLLVDMPDGTQSPLPAVMIDKKKIGRRMSLFLCALAQDSNADAAIGWAVKPNGKVAVSLRSTGKADCNAIAKHIAQLHGIDGGGHRGSAAVMFNTLAQFRTALPPMISPKTPKARSAP